MNQWDIFFNIPDLYNNLIDECKKEDNVWKPIDTRNEYLRWDKVVKQLNWKIGLEKRMFKVLYTLLKRKQNESI